MRRGMEVVEFCCGLPHIMKGESLRRSRMRSTRTRRASRSACARASRRQLPAMVPCGCTRWPSRAGTRSCSSEREGALTAVRLGELLKKPACPRGVQHRPRGREGVDALCKHRSRVARSASSADGASRDTFTLGHKDGKRVQSAGGAKKVLLVMPDARARFHARAILGSAFGNAGQRCRPAAC